MDEIELSAIERVKGYLRNGRQVSGYTRKGDGPNHRSDLNALMRAAETRGPLPQSNPTKAAKGANKPRSLESLIHSMDDRNLEAVSVGRYRWGEKDRPDRRDRKWEKLAKDERSSRQGTKHTPEETKAYKKRVKLLPDPELLHEANTDPDLEWQKILQKELKHRAGLEYLNYPRSEWFKASKDRTGRDSSLAERAYKKSKGKNKNDATNTAYQKWAGQPTKVKTGSSVAKVKKHYGS